ncbi:serine/threonine-protein kinase [Solirubrobacter soli]|uniref:serine/threonine-protein kinase n=1 Tax=Solirubrobacter soli TaxID=363832 RepID=UPI0003FC5520|nr:serine/threonine-protein kinase [Solirubrobacter soli]
MPPVSPDRISLPDRYRVVRHLANGGMASVWEAHDELLDRDVAVKLLASHLGEDSRARRRFQREARAAAGLSSHPNVVTIYDVGEHSGRVFMVMEIMRGGTLGDRLKSREDVPHAHALRWLREAAAALDAAHAAGVVHRDIKPGNLLLDGRDRLAVADFGIARLAWEDQLTATGQVLGTAAYLSPEQAMGEAATPASDRYALAVVAYELLTGTRPFEAEHFAAQARAHVEDPVPPASTRAVVPLSQAVDAALEKGLAKDPADRWESAEAFVDALERTLASPREETKPTRLLGGRRGKGAAAAGGAAAGAGGAWAADEAASRRSRQESPPTDEYDAPGGGAGGRRDDAWAEDRDARRGGAGRDASADGRGGRRDGAADDVRADGRGGRRDGAGDDAWADGRGARRDGAGDDGRGGDRATRRRALAAGGGGRNGASGRSAAPERGRRRSPAPLLAALAAVAVLAVIAAIALANRGGGGGDTPRAEDTPTATATKTAKPERTKTPAPTKTATPAPTETPTPTETTSPEPTPTATATPTPAAPSGNPSELQAKGHTALLAGDIQGALTNLKAAVDACGDSSQVDPCAYAMYDYGAALVAAGRPAEAAQVLEARLARFDNQNGTVRDLLKKARKAAKQGGGDEGG